MRVVDGVVVGVDAVIATVVETAVADAVVVAAASDVHIGVAVIKSGN